MGVRVESGAEPIPGYRLIERLGGGGFGEVWKAEAPGGLFKAIKFVYGDLQAAGDDGCRAEQELKGLSRVKSVHHPYILSLERFDIIEGQLIIVMELADRTIWDRFQECRGQGLPGIPRPELIDYLRETAEALDLMNIEYQLQHLDIKPQNLFLNRNHVKVADFGLVKDLEGMNGATVTGGVTPVYAAPETFDGRISRFSDQYSLAIVYQELLTGVRPFSGSTMRQLILQHLQGTPDVTSLPIADRPVILRALSKNPDERFASCIDMIHGLADVKAQAGASAPAAMEKEKDKAPQREDLEITREVRGKKDRASDEDAARPAAPGSTTEHGLKGPITNDTPARPQRGKRKKQAEKPEPPPDLSVQSMPLSMPLTPSGPVRVEDIGAGNLQPGLVIGLGQMGIDTLKQLRKLLNEEFLQPEALPHLRLLALDTDPEAVQAAAQGEPESRLRLSEVMHTALRRPSHYLKGNDSKTILDGWLNSRMIYRIPRQPTQAGCRSLGRLAFVDNYRAIHRRLETELQACCSDDTLHELSQHTDAGLRTRVPRIYIVSSLSGTTGSGMFLDVAYVVRQMLRRFGHPNAEIVGIFFLPLVGKDPVRMRALANTYAALTELKYFSSGEAVFRARFASVEPLGPSIKSFTEAGPPFHRTYLLNLPEPRPGSLSSVRDATEVVTQAGEYIFRDLATLLGKEMETRRREKPEILGPQYHTFGLCRLVWPRRQIIEKSARGLCRRLIDRWLSKDASSMKEEIHAWSQQEWETHGFRVENLIALHHEKCEALLKQAPDRMFGQIIAPLAEQLAKPVKLAQPQPGSKSGHGEVSCLNIGPAVQAMDQLEKLLGLPEECRPKGPSPEPSVIEKALAEVAAGIADRCDKTLAELVVRHLIEEPRFRLAGAEEALRQFSAIAEQSLQAHEQLAKELGERTIALYQKIHKVFDTPISPVKPATSMWKGAFSRRTPAESISPAAELVELLRNYAKCRYQSMVLHHITCLYVSLRGLLSDQVREVGFCRTRLTELRGLIEGNPQTPTQPGQNAGSPREKFLLPEGCVDIKDAINQLDEEIGPDDLLEFDHVVQQLLHEQFQALVHVCMGPSSIVKSLAPALLHEAIRFLEPRLAGTNAAEMYLGQHCADRGELTAEIKEELTSFYAAAAPPLAKDVPCQETAIITLPKGAAGDRLRNFLHGALDKTYILTAPPTDEVLFFRERGPLALEALEQLGELGAEAYNKFKGGDPAALHTREDIPDWLEV